MTSIDSFSLEEPLSLPVYKVYRRRFYVLLVFSFLAFNQCLFALTFAPIYTSTQAHYDIGEATVDLLLAWGPIIFIPSLPLAYVLLNRRNGLRYCVILAAILDLIATTIRVIPSIVIASTHANFSSISLPFLHVGQILNAGCGPLVMAPVSQLSSLWFNTNERTRATTAAIMAYNLGSTSGFLLGPAVASSEEYVPRLLYVHVGFAVAACILALAYFPSQPPTPPSPAAELLMHRPSNDTSTNACQFYLENLRQCFTTRAFVLLALAGGLIGGTYGAWISLFDAILDPENYTETQIGWFGFATSTAEIVGGLCLAAVADMPRFHHSFKTLILVSLVFYLLSIAWFNLSIHTLFYDQPPLPTKTVTIAFAVTMAGLFQGAASPLTYETLAEIMYPLPESLSASILVEFINVTSLILLFIAPDRYKVVNFTILIIITASIALVASSRFTYRRRDADRTKRLTLVSFDSEHLHDMNQSDAFRKRSNVSEERMSPIFETSEA